jgi:hypothetical protein
MTRLLFSLLLALVAVFAAPAARAEDLADRALRYTVGEIVAVDGVPYAYLAWQGGSTDEVLANAYAIYAKPGPIASSAPFARLGVTTFQSSPSTALALLRLGHRLDARGDTMRDRIETLFRDAYAQPGASLTLRPAGPDAGPGAPTLDTAEKLLQLMWAAAAQPEDLGGLLTFGRTHPGVMLALGQAYAAPLAAPVTTFEIRLLDHDGADLRVVGRVELDQAAPPVLPAPGPALLVPHTTQIAALGTSPKDHLVARLRWSMGPELRDALPAANGYDLYRLPKASAEALGWHLAPPAPAALLAAVAAGTVTPVNQLPIFAAPLLDAAGAANPADRETFHYADDNQQVAGRPRFADGEQVYYFVAARTYTARPGLVSPGSLVTFSHRLPPSPPEIVRVENTYTTAATADERAAFAGDQRLKVVFRQLPDLPAVNGRPDPRQPGAYHLYRWASPRDYLSDAIDPLSNPALIATIPHVVGATLREFTDEGPGAPSLPADAGITYYYTARAVDSASGTPNYGFHSGPAFGVLRDRLGPAAPFGMITPKILETLANHDTTLARPFAEAGAPALTDGGLGFGVQITRLDPAVEQWEIAVYRAPETIIPIATAAGRFAPGEDEVRRTFPIVPAAGLSVEARGASGTGSFGLPFSAPVPAEAPGSASTTAWRLDFSLETQVTENFSSAGAALVHDLVGPQREIIPITGQLSLPAGAGSWRIYRRIGPDGELALIANGRSENLPPFGAWSDPTPPVVTGLQVCYYGQTFDADGNPSPLSNLGCVTVRRSGADLPVPILARVKNLPALPDGRAQLQLEWFSDPVSVERFEILVAARDAATAAVSGPQFAPLPLPAAIHPEANPADLAFTLYQSTRVGGGLGSGPTFTAIATVPADQALVFAVRAVGPGSPGARPRGGLSNLAEARWIAQPAPAGPVIPWPQRPLPGVLEVERAVADYRKGEGPLYATRLALGPQEALAGIVVGYLPTSTGTFEPSRDTSGPRFVSRLLYPPTLADPATYGLRIRPQGENGSAESLFPFVVYRHQLPSARYPAAVPNLVQVSPRIDRVSFRRQLSGVTVNDPFLAFLPFSADLPLPLSGTFRTDGAGYTVGNVLSVPINNRPAYLRDFGHALVWKDPMPAARGALYRYLLVQFDTDGEIKRILPTNPVLIAP